MWISAVLICDMPANEPNAQVIQRWFKSFVGNLDPVLQTQISQENLERVFTVSMFCLSKGRQPSWLRITSVDDRLSELLKKHLPELCNEYLQLDNGDTIKVIQVHLPETLPLFLQKSEVNDRFDPLVWIGCVSQTQLISTIMQMPPKYRLRLFFHTATSLRKHTPSTYIKSDLLPSPLQIFETYARRWQTFTSSFPIIPLTEFLREYTHLSGYNLRTHSIDGWHWGRVIGFTGYTDYKFAGTRYLPSELARDRDYLIQTCYLLAAFSFFVGTGQLTSFGLGQTLPRFV